MHLRQTSNCLRTVAARTTWRCRSGLHSRSCPDVCKYLRPIRWLAAILCTYPAVGTAGGSSFYGSLKPSLNNPSLDDTRAVLQFSRSEHHGAYLFLITKYGMVSASNLSLVSRLCLLWESSKSHTCSGRCLLPNTFNKRNTGSWERSRTTRSIPLSPYDGSYYLILH